MQGFKTITYADINLHCHFLTLTPPTPITTPRRRALSHSRATTRITLPYGVAAHKATILRRQAPSNRRKPPYRATSNKATAPPNCLRSQCAVPPRTKPLHCATAHKAAAPHRRAPTQSTEPKRSKPMHRAGRHQTITSRCALRYRIAPRRWLSQCTAPLNLALYRAPGLHTYSLSPIVVWFHPQSFCLHPLTAAGIR